MLLSVLYLVVLSAISLSLVAFFLTHPRERREPRRHGEPEPERGGGPRMRVAQSEVSREQSEESREVTDRHGAFLPMPRGGGGAETPSGNVDEGGVR